MWQHHFEFLLLGYGAYLTFSDFCKAALPDIPDQHIAQMVAGIDVIMFRPDEELRRLARLAVDTGVASAFGDGRPPAEIDAELATSDAGRAWLEELEKVKDPWFNMGTGDGLYHYFRSWLDDPTNPVRVDRRAHLARCARDATSSARPSSSPASATAWPRATRRCSPTSSGGRSRSCSCCRARCSRTSRSTSSTATTGS